MQVWVDDYEFVIDETNLCLPTTRRPDDPLPYRIAHRITTLLDRLRPNWLELYGATVMVQKALVAEYGDRVRFAHDRRAVTGDSDGIY